MVAGSSKPKTGFINEKHPFTKIGRQKRNKTRMITVCDKQLILKMLFVNASRTKSALRK